MKWMMIGVCYFFFLIPVGIGQKGQLQQAADKLASDMAATGAVCGIHIIGLDSAWVPASVSPKSRLIPASTLKLITTGAALHILGPRYRYVTSLAWYQGSLVNGVLKGNLILQSGGDPLLAFGKIPGNPQEEQLLVDMVVAVIQSGIARIEGKLFVVDRFFDDPLPPGPWALEDMGNYYASPVAGIAWNGNRYSLTFRTGKPGSGAELLKIYPDVPGIEHIVQVVAGPKGSGDQAYIHGGHHTYTRYVKGMLPPNSASYTIRGSVPDPALYAGSRLLEALSEAGVTISEGIEVIDNRQPHPAGKTMSNMIWQHYSPNILAIARYIHLNSDNLVTEMLVKTMAKVKGKPANTAGGLAVLGDFLSQLKVPEAGYSLKDGSGLARNSLFSAEAMTAYLKGMKQMPIFDDWLGTMAEAGKEGTMRLVQLSNDFKGTLYGKSGYMDGVRSYAGYYRSEGGLWYAYSYTVNHSTATPGAVRAAITRVFEAMGSLP